MTAEGTVEDMEARKKHATRIRAFIYFAAGMAGLLFGLDQGVISGALPFISKEWSLGSVAQEWVVSSMMIGAATGAVVASFLARGIGRKKSLMTGATLFIIGCLGSGLSTGVTMLVGFRLILGLSITYFSYSGSWRSMLSIIAIPGFILILTVFTLPDSPRWLATKGRFEEAGKVLNMLHEKTEVAEEELADIKETLKVKQAGWHLFKANKNVRRAVFLGVLLQAMQQFTGFNVIMYYSPKILGLAGFSSTEDQMIGTVINGIVFTLATFIAVGMVDKSGRKPALKIGFFVMAVSMAVVGVCMTMLEGGSAPAFVPYLAAIMTMLMIAGFAMSAGPIVWVLCSEIQPLKSREFGVACSTMTNWITCAIVGATFLSLIDALGSANTFWLYAALNAVFIFLTIGFVPETKNVTLEEIEKNLMSGKKLRDIGC